MNHSEEGTAGWRRERWPPHVSVNLEMPGYLTGTLRRVSSWNVRPGKKSKSKPAWTALKEYKTAGSASKERGLRHGEKKGPGFDR